jgi:hypothetical protein
LLEWFNQPNSSDVRALGAREDIIALSLMYSWLPGAVLLSSMIRPSSTSREVYGLLQGFHKNFTELIPTSDSNSLDIILDQPNPKSLIRPPNFWRSGVAILIVGAGVIPILLLFCHSPLVTILDFWAFSFLFDLIVVTFAPEFGHNYLLFPFMFYKDLFIALFISYVFIVPICLQTSTIFSQDWAPKMNRVSYLNALIYSKPNTLILLLVIVVVLGIITLTNHSTRFEAARNNYWNVRRQPIGQALAPHNSPAYVWSSPQPDDTEPKLRNNTRTKYAPPYNGGEIVTPSSALRPTKATAPNNNPEE